MVEIWVKAHVADDGTVTLHLPDDFPRGDVSLKVQIEDAAHVLVPNADANWTEQELADLRRELEQIQPVKSGAEIVAWLHTQAAWEGDPLPDGAEWVEAQRLKRKERSRW